MANRTGIMELPLHSGKAPRWLFDLMVKLSQSICVLIVEEYGQKGLLTRLSDPFFFQALGCLLGFDWHSSGLTTTTLGALKLGLKGTQKELGIFVAGGKGKTSKNTPKEIVDFSEKFKIKKRAEDLVYTSKMVAKVDSSALQDGYQIYHHSFIFTNSGDWLVIQQGMNPETKYARRYHWLSDTTSSFVEEPHKAIICDKKGTTLNLVAKEANGAREITPQLASEKPEKVISELIKLKYEKLPKRHEIFVRDLNPKNFDKILVSTYENQPKNFEKLLSIKGVGPKTIRALTLISELVYGNGPSYNDPVTYSFAHGGKDGIPYPVNKTVYRQSIDVLEKAIKDAKVGREQKLKALKRMHSMGS